MRRARLLLLLPLIVLFTGCAEPAPPAAPTPESTVRPDVEMSQDRTPTADASAGAGPTAPSPAAPGASTRCEQDALRIEVAQGDSGAGHEVRRIRFTNVSGEACTLLGAPDVFVVDADGSQIGRAAEPTGQPTSTVRLPPGGTAQATLIAVNIGTDGGPLGEACGAVDGDGYAVTAPGSTRFTVVKQGVPACSSDAVWLRIGPVVAATDAP